MGGLIRQLDDLLRGRKTGAAFAGDSGAAMPLRTYLPLAIGLGAIYGFFMGWYGLAAGDESRLERLIASTVKLPALFLLTLAVTFPSMYVFSALAGSRLSFLAALRLAVAGIVVNLAVAASFGPVLAFFTLSTESYSFMVLLNVALLGIAGVVGLGFLLRSLRVLVKASDMEAVGEDGSGEYAGAEEAGAGPEPLAASPRDAAVRTSTADFVFRVWIVLYAVVGAQMGWILRPFIGSPKLPFEWIRGREGNFVLGVYWAVRRLLNAD